jgi:hypothetical protein
MKYTINTTRNRTGCGNPIELDAERILCNDIVFPGEFNPNNVRLWVIGNEYGSLCAVWAGNEQNALDESCDRGLMDSFLVSEEDIAKSTEDERVEWTHLGNAGECADLNNAWMAEATFDKVQDFTLLMAFAEARGACNDNLDK